jgi:hypothetical protein
MANRIPVDSLYYTTLVTRDAKAMARKHAEFYGINKWKVMHCSPNRLKDTSFRGRGRGIANNEGLVGNTAAPGEFGFTSALGASENGGVAFQIVQPTVGLSTFEHFLCTRGPGVHGVFMSVVQERDFEQLRDWLAHESIPIAQAFTIADAARFYFFDTRKALGGFYIQVVVPLCEHWSDAITVDEEWDFSNAVNRPPGGIPPTRIIAIPHFGVVVHDVEPVLERFARLFAQPRWRGMNWRTEKGSLEDTTNNGKPVAHAYFTGRSDLGKNALGQPFGFEIVQPTFGPSHYKEDFLLSLGPGIHHVDLAFAVEDWPEWEALNKWMADDLDAPTCMSGWLRNRSALFQYQDTRKSLGYVVEIHAPRPQGVARMRSAPDYWYDFAVPAPT